MTDCTSGTLGSTLVDVCRAHGDCGRLDTVDAEVVGGNVEATGSTITGVVPRPRAGKAGATLAGGVCSFRMSTEPKGLLNTSPEGVESDPFLSPKLVIQLGCVCSGLIKLEPGKNVDAVGLRSEDCEGAKGSACFSFASSSLSSMNISFRFGAVLASCDAFLLIMPARVACAMDMPLRIAVNDLPWRFCSTINSENCCESFSSGLNLGSTHHDQHTSLG